MRQTGQGWVVPVDSIYALNQMQKVAEGCIVRGLPCEEGRGDGTELICFAADESHICALHIVKHTQQPQ